MLPEFKNSKSSKIFHGTLARANAASSKIQEWGMWTRGTSSPDRFFLQWTPQQKTMRAASMSVLRSRNRLSSVILSAVLTKMKDFQI